MAQYLTLNEDFLRRYVSDPRSPLSLRILLATAFGENGAKSWEPHELSATIGSPLHGNAFRPDQIERTITSLVRAGLLLPGSNSSRTVLNPDRAYSFSD